MPKLQKIVKICKVFLITLKYLKIACKPKANVDLCKKYWSHEIISLFNLKISVIGNPVKVDGPYLLIGNHISYLDIPVILNSSPDITFVSKSEIKSWPIIGKAAVKGQTIFVERKNNQSRHFAKNQIAKQLVAHKQKVIIFPSGTTSVKASSVWQKGAFDIAKNTNIKIQPFRINYNPLRAAAFIGNDAFLTHMYQLFNFDEIKVTLEFHDPVNVSNVIDDCLYWKEWCEQ